MEKKLKCFVIIGYGKKTSYANGKPRILDLDQTYKYLIKPVFDELGIDCYRAIDKNVNGSIDELMLKEILEADIALADISTLNANVMWELGVRHALKKNYTVMICEKEQMSSIPFDINHFIVHQYVHSEAGIPFEEVDRFRGVLKGVMEKMLAQEPPVADSPVFQYVDPHQAYSEEEANAKSLETTGIAKEATFSEVIELAEKAKDSKDFKEALKQYAIAKKLVVDNMSLRDNLEFIIARQALCTFKSAPESKDALIKAVEIMAEINPKTSMNIEVLGINGGIYKRLHLITKDDKYLEEAIWFYEKGFQLKQDYFNGINAVFMLYQKAKELSEKGNDYGDVKLKADYINSVVLNICRAKKKEEKFDELHDAVWIIYTIAECYNYRGETEKQKEFEKLGDELVSKTKDEFAKASYNEQRKKIEELELNKF